MRPNTPGSLRLIAVGLLLLSGCYRPWMQPGYGYGSPMYGNQYQGGYGGYQGIQTLTPGQYYDPGSTVPGTYAPASNGLQPTPDSGSGGGTGGGASDGGGDAAPYNPGVGDSPSKPVPNDPFYNNNESGDGTGSGLVPPETEGPINRQKLDQDNSSSQAAPAAAEDWAEPTIEQASGRSEAAAPAARTEDIEAKTAEVLETESTEATDTEAHATEVEEEAPPRLAP